jgi:pyruvate formate lyase activating enzyme
MIIGGMQKLTLIDYPGKLATTIFLSGCNFRCPFCYNPELVLPEKIKEKISLLDQEEIFSFLNSRKGMIDGVVICGGEPTLHNDLSGFIEKIKEMNFAVKLDTNGSNPRIVSDLISKHLIDYVAMDIKAPKEKYNILAGNKFDLKKIEETIGILKNGETDYEFRTTVVPLLLEKEDIISIAQWIKPAKKYYLQQFKVENTLNSEFSKLNPYSDEYLLEIKDAIAPFFEVCQIRK